MKTLVKWTSRVLIVLAGIVVSLALVIWIADPAVLRNMAFGPRMGDVVELERMQPQEAVPGVARADLPTGPADSIASEGLATAERLYELVAARGHADSGTQALLAVYASPDN